MTIFSVAVVVLVEVLVVLVVLVVVLLMYNLGLFSFPTVPRIVPSLRPDLCPSLLLVVDTVVSVDVYRQMLYCSNKSLFPPGKLR